MSQINWGPNGIPNNPSNAVLRPDRVFSGDDILRDTDVNTIIDNINHLDTRITPVDRGGTGETTFTNNRVIRFDGTSLVSANAGASGSGAGTALTGASVISNLILQDGIVTGVTTRNLTAADVRAVDSTHGHDINSTRILSQALSDGISTGIGSVSVSAVRLFNIVCLSYRSLNTSGSVDSGTVNLGILPPTWRPSSQTTRAGIWISGSGSANAITITIRNTGQISTTRPSSAPSSIGTIMFTAFYLV